MWRLIKPAYFAIEVLYVHGFAMFKTMGLLTSLNKHKDEISGELLEMFLYWIILCASTLIEQNLAWLVDLHFLRISLLIAMLTPKVNLKRKLLQTCITGDKPLFEIALKEIGQKCAQGIEKLKKIE
jgi:hypothetical protein